MSQHVLEQSRVVADQALTAVSETQNAVINLVETFVKNLPAGAAVPGVPADAPSAHEVTATVFDYAEKIVANQRAFADRLISAGTSA